MKCPHCKEETLKILGETYCPACYKKGHKAHRKMKFSLKKQLTAFGFSLLTLSVSAALFSLIYNLTSNNLSQPSRYALMLLAYLITFFVGGAVLYITDRDNLILNALIISVMLSLMGLSLGAIAGFGQSGNLATTLFDIYLFLLMFITGAFIVDHYKNRN